MDILPADVHLLINRSLWDKFFPGQNPPKNVTVIRANLKYFKYTGRLFYPFYIVYLYYKHRCTSMHIANSIINPILFIRLVNYLRIPYCYTFPSNSIEMIIYGSEKRRRYYTKLLSMIRNLDILNPTHHLDKFPARKFISPTSFPYIRELNDIPEEQYTQANRENVIVFSGSFIPQKNPDLAVEGFYEFLKCNPESDARLALIGKGDMFEQLNSRVNEINLAVGRTAITFENESSLFDVLSRSKIFLSLQDFDNYPSQSVMEAMLFCNSIVSIDNGDTSRLVLVEKNNILLRKKSPEDLGKNIGRLLEGWQLNRVNRQHILEHFTAEKYGEYFFDIHRQLATRK